MIYTPEKYKNQALLLLVYVAIDYQITIKQERSAHTDLSCFIVKLLFSVKRYSYGL